MSFQLGLAGVSSLSNGGVNGHVVLEPSSQSPFGNESLWNLEMFLVSGRSKNGLNSFIASNVTGLQDPEFRQLLHSAFGSTISGHNYRGYGVLLANNDDDTSARNVYHVAEALSSPPPLWYMFTGLRSEVQGIETSLIENCLPFASSLKKSERILTEEADLGLRSIITSNGPVKDVNIQIALVMLTAVHVKLLTNS